MKHLALIIPTLNRIGGAERQLVLLAKGMVKRGWSVDVLTLSGDGGEIATELAEGGVRIFSLNMRKGLLDPRGWLKLRRWLRTHSPDVVHAHLPHATWMSRWSRLFAPVRVLVDTIHTPATGGLSRRMGYRLSQLLPDRVTAVSRCVADAYIRAKMVVPSKLEVLRNGIDWNYWQPDIEIRRSFGTELGLKDGFTWLAVGRLERVKNFETLLRAMAMIPDNAQLVIAGEGKLLAPLRQLAVQSGVGERVRFLGFECKLLRWLQAVDAFVLPSLWEGMPIALLEASACALPIVASDIPGNREILEDRVTGYLSDVSDPVKLARTMTAVMRASANEREAMGKRSRELMIERFALQKVLEQWDSLYASLLEENPVPTRFAKRALYETVYGIACNAFRARTFQSVEMKWTTRTSRSTTEK